MVVTLSLFPSLSPSRVKHSLEGQRRDVQLVPAGLHAEAASMRPRPSTDAPFVAALIVSQSDGQTQDARTARLAGEADAEWGLGCGGRGGRVLSAQGRGSEPCTYAQAQPSRKDRIAGGGRHRCHLLPGRAGEGAGLRVTELHSRKERRSLPSQPVSLLHQLAPPLPGGDPALAEPRPRGGGVSGPGIERAPPLSSHWPPPQGLSPTSLATHSRCQHLPEHRRPRLRLRAFASLDSLCQDRHRPHSYPNSAPPVSLIQVDLRRSEPQPPSCPAQTPESLVLSVLGRRPLEILVRTSQAHRRWLRVDRLQGVFVLVLRSGPGLRPLQFGLIHRPPPAPSLGKGWGQCRPSRRRPFPAPIGARRSLPTCCTTLCPTREGLNLGATLTPAPPPDLKLSSSPQDLPLFLSLHSCLHAVSPILSRFASQDLRPCCSLYLECCSPYPFPWPLSLLFHI